LKIENVIPSKPISEPVYNLITLFTSSLESVLNGPLKPAKIQYFRMA